MPFTIHLIGLIFSLICLTFSFGIIWQSERGLDHAFRLLTTGLVIASLNEVLQIILILGRQKNSELVGYLQVLFLFFLTLFLYYFTRTLQDIWKKKK